MALADVALARAKGANKETKSAGGSCVEGDAAAIWWSPRAPVAGVPLQILAVSESAGEGELVLTGPGGAGAGGAKPASIRRTGPPLSLAVTIDAPVVGTYQVSWVKGERAVGCRRIEVTARPKKPEPTANGRFVWEARRAWDRGTENLYSAWIEQLFDAPVDKSLEYRPLHQALREPGRNFLYGYLGLGEDDPKNKNAIPATPDCADLPYYLRAYFSWKLGLPFGFRDCDRGTESRPPRCNAFVTNEQPPEGRDQLSSVKKFFRQVMNRVQSGSARTALADDDTDYYPVKLDKKALRPGVIYADPYGHIMVVVKWAEQTAARGGLLLAVDGQPDTSIGRKRFWEGTFLFTNETKSAGPGFKAFRPVVRGADGQLAPLPNKAVGVGGDSGHAPAAMEQSTLSGEAFYARMGKLINPEGLDAVAAYSETLDALVEQTQVRIGSVDNGEKYMRENNNPVVPMPEGAKIFETTGPWEDYATPSRDMRLIIAMNVLLGLPERIIRHPELYVLGKRKPEAVRDEVARLHKEKIGQRGIEYRRSDGSPWKLTVADLLARKTELEMAYNPNDCVEVRWGAKEGTPEYATCKRRAADDQKARMGEYRGWFRDARRPPR